MVVHLGGAVVAVEALPLVGVVVPLLPEPRQLHALRRSLAGRQLVARRGRVAYIVNEPVGTPLTLPLELPLTKV